MAPLIILFCVVASSSIIIIVNLQDRLVDIEGQSLINSKINKAIFNFDQLRSSIRTDLLAYLLTSENALKKSIAILEARRLIEEPKLFDSLKVRADFVNDFKKLELTYVKTFNLRKKIINSVESKNSSLALKYFNSYSSIHHINSARLIDMRNKLEVEATLNRIATKKFYNWLFVFMLFILLFGSVVILYSLAYYKENLLLPIKKLKLGLNKIQKGDFPTIDENNNSSIEVQEIVKDFNETALNLQKIKRELLESNKNALNLAKIKSDFLSNMSHEIRTPLNSIIGMGNLLQDFEHEKDVQDYISTIVSNGDLLLNIVNDILDLSKLETGKIELDPLPCEVEYFVKRIESSFAHLFKEKSLTFSIYICPETPKYILADYNRLEQIILNLLSNAYKFTPSGGVSLSISKSFVKNVEMLEFKIEDTGIGIDNEIQLHLFTRFTQADSSITRQYGGTGLGLSIVKELVELMQGSIEVSSIPGKGSNFSIYIPLEKIAPEDFQEAQKHIESPNQVLKTFKNQPRILLVDDSKENRKIVTLFLGQLPIEIDEAENGIEAIAAFEKNNYQLILMDMQMPVLDGHSATKKIREIEIDRLSSRIPILALTAYVMQEEVEKSKAAGCDAHLSKPINRDVLINTVIQYLNM